MNQEKLATQTLFLLLNDGPEDTEEDPLRERSTTSTKGGQIF